MDAYNDPTAEADLKSYSEEFGAAALHHRNGCFKQVNQNGEAAPLPFPEDARRTRSARRNAPAKGRSRRSDRLGRRDLARHRVRARDLPDLPHRARRGRRSELYEDLDAAEHAAGDARRAARSRTRGAAPEVDETAERRAASAFNHPGIVITASAGDNGYLNWDAESAVERGYAEFPASSPHVVAVGGTRLSARGRRRLAGRDRLERLRRGGGGCSVVFDAPAWQQSAADWSSVGCGEQPRGRRRLRRRRPLHGRRDPRHERRPANTPTKKPKSTRRRTGARTAAPASPRRSSPRVFALAGGASGVAYPAQTLYENALRNPAALHDVRSAPTANARRLQPKNGPLQLHARPKRRAELRLEHLICLAAPGYDGPTGVGTPDGIAPSCRTAPKRDPVAEPAAARAPAARRPRHSSASPATPPAGTGVDAPAGQELTSARADASRRSWL